MGLAPPDPCHAEEICTRMLESRVRGIEGEAGTDLGLEDPWHVLSGYRLSPGRLNLWNLQEVRTFLPMDGGREERGHSP